MSILGLDLGDPSIAAALAGAISGSVIGTVTALLVAGVERRRRGYERALKALTKITVEPNVTDGERVSLGIAEMYPALYLFLPKALFKEVSEFGRYTRDPEYLRMNGEARAKRDQEFVESIAAKLWRRSGTPLRWFRRPPKYYAWEQTISSPVRYSPP